MFTSTFVNSWFVLIRYYKSFTYILMRTAGQLSDGFFFFSYLILRCQENCRDGIKVWHQLLNNLYIYRFETTRRTNQTDILQKKKKKKYGEREKRIEHWQRLIISDSRRVLLSCCQPPQRYACIIDEHISSNKSFVLM